MRFVLVRPRNPLNIGAAARAVANFGFSDFTVVKPYAPSWQETKSAPGAEKLVLNAVAHNSLEAALEDRTLVIGTTAVRERRHDRPVVSLPDLAEYLKQRHPEALRKNAPTAVLFGSEKTGLTGATLARCHFWLTIPTDAGTPSMNLGQAVAVCAYVFGQILGTTAPPPARRDLPLSTEDRERLIGQAVKMFEASDYLPFLNAAKKSAKVRERFLRWNVDRGDTAMLHGLMRFVLRKLKGDA